MGIVDTALTISVAMCTCNGEVYLREQLESILAQTVPPNELIVCDDASTDGTVALLESFKKTSPFPITIIVNKSRVGVCKNFESAVGHCSGDIIFLADQDDIWLPAKLETIMAVFASHPHCGYVFSNAELVDEQGNDIGMDLWTSIAFDKKQQAQYSLDQLSVMVKRVYLVTGMTMAFRAILKSKVMPFESCTYNALLHDAWISLLLTSIGANGIPVPGALVKYRQHAKQLLSAGKPLGFADLVAIKRSTRTKLDLELAESLVLLEMRLQQLGPQSESIMRARKQLIGKATHIRARARANSSHGLQRFKTVFREALSGRYGLYSRSFKSIVKDLVSS
jgi:glycosyltransferase involved in cell wall biosynthesis